MKHYILNLLNKYFDVDITLEKPKDRSLGHFSTPIAFVLAKKDRKSPILIANNIALKLSNEPIFDQVKAVKGYINFYLSDAFLNKYATKCIEDETNFGKSNKKGKILLEFVSANPTGPLHIGHARAAIYGDTLLRLGRHLGFDITAEYYINDTGNQMNLLGTSIILQAQSTFLNMNIKFPDNFYRGKYMEELAKAAQVEFGNSIFTNKNIKKLAYWGKDKIMVLILATLKDYNINFDTFVNEKSLYDHWDQILNKLKSNNAVFKKDKKLWLKSSAKGDEKDRVIVRETGEPTYLVGDIIYHNQKFERGYDCCINIWGADHHGYIARVKAAIDFMGFKSSKLEILLSQMVSLLKDGKPYKMSKREGNVILMSDIVKEIGSDALRFMFASKKLDISLEFDVEDLKKHDASNPIFYINYAHARIQTLLAKTTFLKKDIQDVPLIGLGADGKNLLFDALQLPFIIEVAFDTKEVQKLPDYLKKLAASLHKYYVNNKIINNKNEILHLKLMMVVAVTIRIGLELMGIKAKDKM